MCARLPPAQSGCLGHGLSGFSAGGGAIAPLLPPAPCSSRELLLDAGILRA